MKQKKAAVPLEPESMSYWARLGELPPIYDQNQKVIPTKRWESRAFIMAAENISCLVLLCVALGDISTMVKSYLRTVDDVPHITACW